MTTAVVFAGPTIAKAEVEARGFLCLPPVAQGDVYRAVRLNPRAIGIVDGYFDGSPAVWHKEILFALTRGIAVFGAASMGALRAAELHSFGMRGVGAIFEAYRAGSLNDDDEVALIHGPAETDFLGLSIAMVDIRATIAAGVAAAKIAPAEAEALIGAAKALFYPDRQWPRICADAGLGRLEGWLGANQIEQKHWDASAMLDAIDAWLVAGTPTRPIDFHFVTTDVWERGAAAFGAEASLVMIGTEERAVLDELRLAPAHFARIAREAALNGPRAGPDTAGLASALLNRFREQRQLYTAESLRLWLEANRISREALAAMLRRGEKRDAAIRRNSRERPDTLIEILRLSGDYAALAQRARDKDQFLSDAGLLQADAPTLGSLSHQLIEWFCAERLGWPMPDDVDGLAAEAGFHSMTELLRAAAREYAYVKRGLVKPPRVM